MESEVRSRCLVSIERYRAWKKQLEEGWAITEDEATELRHDVLAVLRVMAELAERAR
jgi:hypothetical protein